MDSYDALHDRVIARHPHTLATSHSVWHIVVKINLTQMKLQSKFSLTPAAAEWIPVCIAVAWLLVCARWFGEAGCRARAVSYVVAGPTV